jgi:hypothetical protein
MKRINIKKLIYRRKTGNIIIFVASMVLIYLIASIYFTKHFFFNTVINGVDVSLKPHDKAKDIICSYIIDYKLQLIERKGEIEEILGQDIGMQYNERNSISGIYQIQKGFKWLGSLFREQKYYLKDLYVYDYEFLENRISALNCLNTVIIEPKNVSFKYLEGSYETIEEVYGNKINKDKLIESIKVSLLKGENKLDLNESLCYENPRYTLAAEKTPITMSLLNKYISTIITYKFGKNNVKLDGSIINQWLTVNENLDVKINKEAVMEYVIALGKKYDTVGVTRGFKTSLGKKVEVKGGLYGWKIDCAAETKALIENIKRGDILEKEPVYSQKAFSRDGDEIGNTYVEINITRQRLWFYKNGRLIAQGAVVTGNPNRGNATKVGTFMLNYKQKDAVLKGADYEAEVTYWMPFFGNMGIHDASWRYSFGGEIYKRNGTHGCVNTPIYLAKKIFDNIEDGTPIISYEESSERVSQNYFEK